MWLLLNSILLFSDLVSPLSNVRGDLEVGGFESILLFSAQPPNPKPR